MCLPQEGWKLFFSFENEPILDSKVAAWWWGRQAVAAADCVVVEAGGTEDQCHIPLLFA